MSEHLPVLIVVIPLLSAALCVLIRHALLVQLLAVSVIWLCLGIAWSLLNRVQETGPISYWLGNWTTVGIEYRIDVVNAYLALIITATASVVLAFGPTRSDSEIAPKRAYLYFAVLLLAITGLLGMTVTGDAFNLFVFLEISSLATYTLVALGRGRRAKLAAFSYLIIGSIGATLFLLGIGMMYQMTGTLNIHDLQQQLSALGEVRTLQVAFVLLFVGGSIKLALFPLHQWLPNAYAYAPTVVSALLAATATKVGYYILVRIIFTLFGAQIVFGYYHLDMLLVPLSLMAMFSGSIAAIYQTDIKRLLAYSSVAQIGYMTLGLSFNTVTGLSAGLMHLFNHAVIKCGLFLAVASIIWRINSSKIADMRGLGKKMPLTMAAIVVGGLALIGVPTTAGFISKWYLVLGALEKGWYLVAVLVLLSSLLSVIYVWKIVETAYFMEPPKNSKVKEVPLKMLVPVWLLIGATLVFGLWTRLTAEVAVTAASQLMGVQP